MADWPSIHLPSFSLSSFPLSLPLFSRSSLHFVLSRAPLSTWYNIMWQSYQWHVTIRWFSPCTLVSSINKTGRHDIAEILLKVALNTINQYFPFSCISSTPFLTRMNIVHVHVLFQLSLTGWCEMILMIEDLILINQCSCPLLICFMYLRISLSCVHLAC